MQNWKSKAVWRHLSFHASNFWNPNDRIAPWVHLTRPTHTSDTHHPFHPHFFGQGRPYQVLYEWTEVSFIPHSPHGSKGTTKIATEIQPQPGRRLAHVPFLFLRPGRGWRAQQNFYVWEQTQGKLTRHNQLWTGGHLSADKCRNSRMSLPKWNNISLKANARFRPEAHISSLSGLWNRSKAINLPPVSPCPSGWDPALDITPFPCSSSDRV